MLCRKNINLGHFLAAMLVVVIAVSGCARDADRSSQNSSVSAPTYIRKSLIGRWNRSTGPTKYQDTSDYWVGLTFKPSGVANLSYLPANVSGNTTTRSPKSSEMHYSEINENTVRLSLGTEAVTYTYEIQGDQLFLTPPLMTGQPTSLVFKRAHS